MRTGVLTATTVLTTAIAGLGATLTPTAGADPTQPPTDGAEPGQDTRPNIVVIAVDDMAETDLQQMPITRQLVGDAGVRFSNSVAPTPLCCPSRVSLLTGQYMHNHGVRGNGSGVYPEGGYQGFDSDGNTLATWADDAGYQTAFVGKYLNGYGVTGFPARVPPGWHDWHGERGDSYRRVSVYENGNENVYPHTYRTTFTTNVATRRIREHVPETDPLMMFVWHFAPHGGRPIESDDPKVTLDRNVGTPVPARADRDSFAGTPAPRDPSFNERFIRDKPEYVKKRPRFDPIDRQALDELYQQRVETLQAVDRSVGRIVRTLESTGELDNTVLAFTSDNGFMLGQHRVLQGKMMPYEPGIQVPLLIRGPGFPAGVVRHQLVGTPDLAFTLARLAEAEQQRVLDGASLLRMASSPKALARRDIVLEGAPRERGGTLKFLGLRTERYTYVEYPTGERELYDLQRDPYQLRNLIGRPSTDPELVQRLAQQLDEMRDCAGEECRVKTPY